MTHPRDIEYIRTMLPNISADVIEKQKILQPGNCVGFGGAFKLPMVVKMQMPDPAPNSNSCDVNNCWMIREDGTNAEEELKNEGKAIDSNTAQFTNSNPNSVSVPEVSGNPMMDVMTGPVADVPVQAPAQTVAPAPMAAPVQPIQPVQTPVQAATQNTSVGANDFGTGLSNNFTAPVNNNPVPNVQSEGTIKPSFIPPINE